MARPAVPGVAVVVFGSGVAMFNFKPSRRIAAEVTRLIVALRVARRQDSPNLSVVAHALHAPFVLSALPLNSVIVLTQWLLSVALGTRLHGCPCFLLN